MIYKTTTYWGLKEALEQVTGRGKPGRGDLEGLVRARTARSIRLADDGLVPNNPKWPLVVYRSPVRLVDSLDPAAIFEKLFARNGWAIPGATASTTTCTTTPGPMRCWGSPGAGRACNSADATAVRSSSRLAMSQS